MGNITTGLDSPKDVEGVVMEWGDKQGAPFVVSGQALG